MAMRTPEQIASDVYWTLADLPTEPSGHDLRRIMAAAAREAQREARESFDPWATKDSDARSLRDAELRELRAYLSGANR